MVDGLAAGCCGDGERERAEPERVPGRACARGPWLELECAAGVRREPGGVGGIAGCCVRTATLVD